MTRPRTSPQDPKGAANDSPKIVTVVNVPYFLYAKAFLRSLTEAGGVRATNVAVVAFGTRPECAAVERAVHDLDRRIEVVPAPLFDAKGDVLPELRFLEDEIRSARWPAVADYLKAWVGARYPRYVFMDTDILVRRPLDAWRRRAGSATCMSMAQDFSVVDPSRAFHGTYRFQREAYRTLFGVEAPVLTNRRGQPISLNCGVIVVDRNYERDWVELYRALAPLVQRADSSEIEHSVGQSVWNLLHWRNAGQVLDSRFNWIFVKRPLSALRSVPVLHYALAAQKTVFFEDALRFLDPSPRRRQQRHR